MIDVSVDFNTNTKIITPLKLVENGAWNGKKNLYKRKEK